MPTGSCPTAGWLSTQSTPATPAARTLSNKPCRVCLLYTSYDYQFFYRNLQENVEVRLNAYLEDQAA